MKTHTKNLLLVPALIASIALIFGDRAMAQTFTNLYSFTDASDGADPRPVDSIGRHPLWDGGQRRRFGNGTIFAVNTDGTGFTNLYSFTNGIDGANPVAGLILSGNTLFGTAASGGVSGNSTHLRRQHRWHRFYKRVRILLTAPTGPGQTRIDSIGQHPLWDGVFGGSQQWGSVFSVTTDGTDFNTLYSFTNGLDGTCPEAGLRILSGNTLCRTTFSLGSSGAGTVFAVNTDGTGFTTLYSFTGGSDGGNPLAGLILSGNTLYGTASDGGDSNSGTVFAVNTENSTGCRPFLTSVTAGTVCHGARPQAGLILSGNTLYGTASSG